MIKVLDSETGLEEHIVDETRNEILVSQQAFDTAGKLIPEIKKNHWFSKKDFNKRFSLK